MAADLPSSDNTQIILGIFTLLGIVATGVVGIIIALINSRNRASPTSATDTESGTTRERVGVLEFRAEDNDERFDVQDKRQDVIEQNVEHIQRFLDRRFDGWRT